MIIYAEQVPSNIAVVKLGRKGKSMMNETGSANGSEGWKKFFRKHWNILVLFVAAAILASVGAVYVFLWFVGYAQSIGIVPTILGLWTMGNLVAFVLYAIFWELLLIGVPVALAAVAGWLWWRKLPSDEKNEYHFFGRRSRTTSGGGGISLCSLLRSASRFSLMETGTSLLGLGRLTMSCTVCFGY